MLRLPGLKSRLVLQQVQVLFCQLTGLVQCFLSSLAKIVINQLVYLLPVGNLTGSCSVTVIISWFVSIGLEKPYNGVWVN